MLNVNSKWQKELSCTVWTAYVYQKYEWSSPYPVAEERDASNWLAKVSSVFSLAQAFLSPFFLMAFLGGFHSDSSPLLLSFTSFGLGFLWIFPYFFCLAVWPPLRHGRRICRDGSASVMWGTLVAEMRTSSAIVLEATCKLMLDMSRSIRFKPA